MSNPDFSKNHYVVTWSIDEWADDPITAAKMALKDMPHQDKLNTAIFEVQLYDEPKEVDLESVAYNEARNEARDEVIAARTEARKAKKKT